MKLIRVRKIKDLSIKSKALIIKNCSIKKYVYKFNSMFIIPTRVLNGEKDLNS